MAIPDLLCEHPRNTIRRSAWRAECGVCGSYWDLDSLASRVVYDESYPEHRGHFDPRVGALKVKTLRHWLDKTRIQLDGLSVCEVGFGGGTCLPFLAGRAAHVIGLEVNQTAIDRVRATGVRAELLLVDPLPTPSRPVDLWLFQDSFEHIPNPTPFVEWMNAHSAPDATILMVLPRGDSLSRRMLGRLWPHKLPDHEFVWSRAGAIEFLGRHGWTWASEFFPLKYASPEMVLAHGLHKLGVGKSLARALSGARVAFPLNFGEMGLVLRRAAP
ncbi:MAG TPA: methyltransferase domain-containing protein [Gemmatimonadaceae bacterium]|nr:methyltransferase domain-containing protein [Gemmatimonadaceae bacterium]